MTNKLSPLSFANFVLGLFAFGLLSSFVFHTLTYDWVSVYEYRTAFFKGWLMTIILSFAALLLSTFLGLLLALARRSKLSVLRTLTLVYIELIRGTPLLVQILFFYYVVADNIGLENRMASGIVILSLFTSSYISEIIRSGVESIPKSQLDSAKAIGLTKWQTYRLVVFPQAIRTALPALTGQLASLIKDSSLLSIIGIREVTYVAQQINSATFSTLESFFPLACAYLILTLPISFASRALERRYAFVH